MRLTTSLLCVKTAMKSAMKKVEREVSISAPWGKIAALTWGEPSNPAVMLCHGKMDTCSGFRPLVQRLPDKFFYISVDLPGNGRSDHFPRGVLFTVTDFVPTIYNVQRHFNLDKFMYIGHSLGVLIGKYFNIAYPGHITRMVELDPVPAYDTVDHQDLAAWYHNFYGAYYDVDKYWKFNAGVETAPKYTYEKAVDLMVNTRGLTRKAADHVLERTLDPAGDGLFRFTYDQRMKEVPRLPFPNYYMEKIYTSSNIPIFCILAKALLDLGHYKRTPFVNDEASWPNKNFRYKIVNGGHDVHINEPECMADDISNFLLEDFKAKL